MQNTGIRNTSADKRVKAQADATRDFDKNKPADLTDMIRLARINGLKIQIVDDPHYQPTQEDIDKGRHIVMYTEGRVDSDGNIGIGHWSIVVPETSCIHSPNGDGNNCGYQVIANLCGGKKTIQELRESVADDMEKNSVSTNKHLENVAWINNRYPEEANRMLLVGGKARDRATYIYKDLKFPNRDAYLDESVKVNKNAKTNPNTDQGNWGDTFTAMDCSDFCYDDKDVPGLERIGKVELTDLNFKAIIYLNPKTNKIFIAFKGSEFSDKARTWTGDNLHLVKYGIPRRVTSSFVSDYIEKVMKEYPDTPITFTGHSLGASIATYYSSKYKKPAICFDNPGLKPSKRHPIDFSLVTSFQSMPNVVNNLYTNGQGSIVQLAPNKSTKLRICDGLRLGGLVGCIVDGIYGLAPMHTCSQIRAGLDRTQRLATDGSTNQELQDFSRENTKIKYDTPFTATFKKQIQFKAPPGELQSYYNATKKPLTHRAKDAMVDNALDNSSQAAASYSTPVRMHPKMKQRIGPRGQRLREHRVNALELSFDNSTPFVNP